MSQQRIPVSLEILADMETPLSVFKKLGNKPFSYLFESVEGGEKWARYSLIGLPASRVIKVYNNRIQIFKDGKVEEEMTSPDPLKFLQDYQFFPSYRQMGYWDLSRYLKLAKRCFGNPV